jgi:hypothetical protein
MMLRRGVLGLALLPGAAMGTGMARAQAQAQAQTPGGVPADIGFVVVREGREVGTHTVRFRAAQGLLQARSEVRIVVRLAGIPVFRYSHDTEEAWRGDRLVALNSRLDNNGRPGQCEARAEAGGLRLRGTAGEALLPPIAAPLTWWRAPTFLGGVPLFDPRHGLPVSPELRRRPDGAGQRVTLVGGEGAEIVFDADWRWVGFATTGEDGSRVTYRLAA